LMPPNRIQVEIAGRVAHVSLANPPVNVIDIPMMDEMAAELSELESNDAVTTIVFRGKGKSFSAGVDIAAHTPDKVGEMLKKFHEVVLAIARSIKISVAAVHGNCLGGGAELAMVCDVVYTTADAKWGFPEIKLACYPPVACTALAALVGQKRAAELILTGRAFSGADAAKWGLASEVAHNDAELEAFVRGFTASTEGLSVAALKHAKKAIYTWDGLHLDKGLARAEKIYLEELMKIEDVQEGVQAWTAKREPSWRNR
jgi:cyclohexa-1,5-dienecarbonyl-CoA hydratase